MESLQRRLSMTSAPSSAPVGQIGNDRVTPTQIGERVDYSISKLSLGSNFFQTNFTARQTIKVAIVLALVVTIIGVVSTVWLSSQDLSDVAIRTEALRFGKAETSAGEKSADGTAFLLSDIHRVELKDGKPAWEVHAKVARHLTDVNLTHVQDAELKVYRKNKPPVTVKASAGRLVGAASSFSRAELEGEIAVISDKSFTVKTQLAVYDLINKSINSPGPVTIAGEGFIVEGQRMDFDIASEVLTLAGGVKTVLQPSATVPKEFSNARRNAAL